MNRPKNNGENEYWECSGCGKWLEPRECICEECHGDDA